MPQAEGVMAKLPTRGVTVTSRVGHSVMSPEGLSFICFVILT